MSDIAADTPTPEARKRGPDGDAVREIRSRNVLGKMLDVADILYGMLAARQQRAANSPVERAKFVDDDRNVHLARCTIEAFDRVAKYGLPKLSTIDYVGDVPQGPVTVENKMLFVLNVGNDPGRPVRSTNGNGEQHPAPAPARFELNLDAEPGNGQDHNDDG